MNDNKIMSEPTNKYLDHFSEIEKNYYLNVIEPNLHKFKMLTPVLSGFLFESHHIYTFNKNSLENNSLYVAIKGHYTSIVDVIVKNKKTNEELEKYQLKNMKNSYFCVQHLTKAKYEGLKLVCPFCISKFNIEDKIIYKNISSEYTSYEKMIELALNIKEAMKNEIDNSPNVKKKKKKPKKKELYPLNNENNKFDIYHDNKNDKNINNIQIDKSLNNSFEKIEINNRKLNLDTIVEIEIDNDNDKISLKIINIYEKKNSSIYKDYKQFKNTLLITHKIIEEIQTKNKISGKT